MKKYLLITILFHIFLNYSFSQNPHIDSLICKLKKSYGYEQINILNNLSDSYISIHIPTAINFAQQALIQSKKYNYIDGLAYGYLNLGNIYKYTGDYTQCQGYFEKSLMQYNKIKNYNKICNLYVFLSEIQINKSNYSKAYLSLIKSLQIAEKENNLYSQSVTFVHIGYFYISLKNYDLAKLYFNKALYNSIKGKFIRVIIASYGGLSHIAYNQNNYKCAIGYLFEASKFINNSKNEAVKSELYGYFGDLFLKNCDYTKALESYNKTLIINKSICDKFNESNIITKLAHVYQLQKKYKLALQYNQKALKIRKSSGYKLLVGSSYTNVGTSYFYMNDYNNAYKFYQQGLLISKEFIRTDYILYNYTKIYEFFLAKQNFKKALDYYILLSSVNNQIIREENDRKIAEIQLKYEIEKKDQKVNEMMKKNEIQRLILKKRQYFFSALSVFFILISIIVLFFYKQSQFKNKQKNADIEQKLLRSQMNPHFIFNSLISIQSFIFKNNSIDAGSYLSGFAKLIRLVLINSREDFISLEKEIETIKLYLKLQKMRFENKFNYTLTIDEELGQTLVAIPPMMIQPFIENSIEHGILNKHTIGKIDIRIFDKDNFIQIEVEDNGIGREKAQEIQKLKKVAHNALATKITFQRILLMKRKYQMNVDLVITDLKNKTSDEIQGTLIVLKIPKR